MFERTGDLSDYFDKMSEAYDEFSKHLFELNKTIKKRNIQKEPKLLKLEEILSDNVEILNNPTKNIEIDYLLLLSGGGMNSVLFTLGAIGNLIDNGIFYDYEVIGSVSGGAIVLHYIELCYKYNLVGTEDWYNKYVRKPIYDVIMNNEFMKLFQLYGYQLFTDTELFLSHFNKLLLPSMFKKDKKKKLKNANIKYPKFLFNYVNANASIIDHNHDDIKNDKNYYVKRLLRCCSTLINFTFQNKSTYDAGIVDNIATSKLLNIYNSKNVTLVSASNYIVYKKSRLSNGFLTTINLLSLFFNTGNVANFMNIIDGSDALMGVNKMICYSSNSKNPSTNPVHKNLFSDFMLNNSMLKRNFFILYPTNNNMNMLKLIENEGYIQMHSQIKKNIIYKNNILKFHIPNKKQYDKKTARKIYKIFQEEDLIYNSTTFLQFMTDFISITTNKFGLTNTPICVSNKLNLD